MESLAPTEVKIALEPPEDLRSAFERHSTALVRVCTLLTGSREGGEDLAQEAFIRLGHRVEHLAPQAVWPYLYRIAVNLWKNRLRRLRIELRHRRPPEVGRSLGDEVVDERDRIRRALLRLPPRQRACVVLRHYLDLSEEETAEALGCSIGTVKSQASRGLARLRGALTDDE